MTVRSTVLLCIFFLVSKLAAAQTFGGFPPSTRWKQLPSDTARVIFTAGAEEQAARIASIIHRMAADTGMRLGQQLRPVDILLQGKSTLANGFVTLGPFRSEFYLIPGSGIHEFGNLPWHENLAIHEYRHVQQYNHFRRGLSKGFSILFGEYGQSFANALTIPDWFFEGDAVYAETALTRQGRGRLPYFLSGMNALWLENRNYSWQKLRNGSLKDYVPNHYQLGYLLANYGHLKYGPRFWEQVTRDAAAFRGLFYPFQQAVKRYSGRDYKTFRREAFGFYRDRLGAATDSQAVDSGKVTHYYFPQQISDNEWIYLKTAYHKIPAFYITDDRGERKVAQRSISSEEWFSYRKGIIAYTAYSTHPRWSLVDYSDIVLLDTEGGGERRLTQQGRYYTPDFSPAGDRIAAIRITDSLETELLVIRADDGSTLHRIPSREGLYYHNPRFYDDSSIVLSVRTPDARMSLQRYHLASGKWDVLIPPTFHTIGLPFVSGGTVYFMSNLEGNDDLYAYRMKEGRTFQLTRDQTGNYFPSAYRDTLAWSHFTSRGLRLRKLAMDKLLWSEVSPMQWGEAAVLFPVASTKPLLPLPTERFSEKRYRQSAGLFNFHSWIPNYEDPEFTFSLYGDNILSTFSNELFYRYNQNERSHGVGWNTSFSGLYPVINGGIEYTFGRDLVFDSSRVASFDQVEARIGYDIPLNFTKGKTYKFLDFGSDFVYNRSMPRGIYKDSFRTAGNTYLHHFVDWSHYVPRAVQHIYPKAGWAGLVQYRHILGGRGNQLNGTANVFLPSVGNHSIVASVSYQDVDTANIVFPNRFANARGYLDYYFARAWKFAANYHFPIVYPDFGIASIVYFQRLRGNLFYDYAKAYYSDKVHFLNLRSVGAELYFDTKWWNQQPVSFGLRVSRLLDNIGSDRAGDTYFEFILPLNLIPL